MQKISLPIAGERGTRLACGIMVPDGFDVGYKEGEVVLFRQRKSPVDVQKTLGGVAMRVRLLVGTDLRDTRQLAVTALCGQNGVSPEHMEQLRAELASKVARAILDEDFPAPGAVDGAEWRGLPVQASPDELTEELKPTGREPITATEVAGSLGTLGEEQSRSERNRAAFEQAKNTLSGHNMAPSGFEPIHACRCEQCRRHRGERL